MKIKPIKMKAIIAFLHTHKKPDQSMSKSDGTVLSNPIPEPITLNK